MQSFLNGRTGTRVFDATQNRFTVTSPTGRQQFATVDTQGRVTQAQTPGLEAVNYSYDSRGRLTGIHQGAERTYRLSYNPQDYLATLTDPLGRIQSYSYDAAGRVLSETLLDGRSINYRYDSNGNVTSLTPPGRLAHAFNYTPVDLEESYTPPNLGPSAEQTQYSYNLDKQLTRITRPDAQTIDLAYDMGGRLNTLTLSSGQLSYEYQPITGNLATITAPGNNGLSYTYDGSLLLDETLNGPVSGTISRTYDSDFRVESLSVANTPVTYAYDPDSLLIQAGDLTLSRDAQTGLLTGTTLGNLTTRQSYNTFGEIEQFAASQANNNVFTATYTRDTLSRITNKTEALDGSTDSYAYGYDSADRLIEVKKNGVIISSYSYDSNGNRLSKNGASGTYDAQDRLLSYGSATYTYTANGELKTKTQNGETTSYSYDVLGNLRSADLADGTAIEYLIDGRNRRVGKKINSSLTQGLLYQNQLNPIAELDSNGNVVSRFVYASKINVPDYLIKGSISYRIISDHLGSPRLIINTSTGEVVQRMDFDEFGNIIQDTNPGFQPFGFAGGLYDQHTKLTRFGARDYDPETGRWTAKDPIRFEGGDANLYAYVGGNPISLVDPTGEFGIPGALVGAIIGTITGGIGAAATGRSITEGAIAGAVAGAIIGLVPAAGLLGQIGKGGVQGGAGNGIAQALGIRNNPCQEFNFGSLIGSTIGGALGAGKVNLAGGPAAGLGGRLATLPVAGIPSLAGGAIGTGLGKF